MSAHRHVLDALHENSRLNRDLSRLIEESLVKHASITLTLDQLRHLLALSMLVYTHTGRAQVLLELPEDRRVFHVERSS